MKRSSQRRTIGIITSIVGKAIAHDSIHETIHRPSIPGTIPSARQVAKPETRKVMKKLVPKGSAKRRKGAGSFFTVGYFSATRTIWYG